MVFAEQIPESLKEEDQWVCWRTEPRNGKATKVPVDASSGGYAQVDAPETWSSFETVLDYYESTDPVDGIGFVFRENGRYAGVDLDVCRDPETGDVDDWAMDVIRQLDSYTERSPSGTGFHVLVSGEVPDGGNRHDGVEMYDNSRYFTVTGDHIPDSPKAVEERSDRLEAVHDEYVLCEDDGSGSVQSVEGGDVSLPDDELIEKAVNATNGDKFRRLWNGDISGYESHSEADQALCTMLAFWTGGDYDRIEELFSRSGLVREKWWSRADYRERTIRNGIQYCSDFYEPTSGE